MIGYILGSICSVAGFVIWGFGIRTHLRKMKRTRIIGSNILFCIYGDWQECWTLGKTGDAKAAQLSKAFIYAHLGYIIAVLLCFLEFQRI